MISPGVAGLATANVARRATRVRAKKLFILPKFKWGGEIRNREIQRCFFGGEKRGKALVRELMAPGN